MTTWTDVSFLGGHPALDFVNTAGGRTKARDTERLLQFQDATGWGRVTGLLDPAETDQLTDLAVGDPAEAERAVAELRQQREALHTFLLAGIDGTTCEPRVRRRVHADILTAYREALLSERFRTDSAWFLDVTTAGMRLLALRIALAGAALLASEQRSQIGVCGRCSWLFLDPSSTRRRRWCSMATCGNRAKAERHQRR